jgi:hypothetical protein
MAVSTRMPIASATHGITTVDTEMCQRVAKLIASQEIPEDREEILNLALPKGLIGNFYLVLVAICHQTSPPDRPPLVGIINGVVRRGWDYLLSRFYQAAQSNFLLLSPTQWSKTSEAEVEHLFRDEIYGNRLSNPEERSQLIRDLGDKMVARGWQTVEDIHRECEGRIATGYPNLLQALSLFRAYDDPVKKKAFYFLAVMRNGGYWRYQDNELLGPPVDYHEVRGHLRLGTVRINDRVLSTKLRSGEIVTAQEDIAIRQAVYDAIMLISEQSGIRNPSQLHYLFWNIFRSVCLREAPQCHKLDPNSALPNRYRHLALGPYGERCPFASICESANIPHPIYEHRFLTDYY